MLIENGLPEDFMERDSVKKTYLAVSRETLDFRGATAQRESFDKRKEEALAAIAAFLLDIRRVSLAVDSWAHRIMRASFLAINVYCIDQQWNFHEMLIGFPDVIGKHTGAAMAELVIEAMKKVGITSKVQSLTSDNASNNRTMHRAM